MTSQFFLPWNSPDAATFRVWGEGISLQLTAHGWTKTSDTGQVDWTTNPARPSNAFLYEIREPASDPLQTGSTKIYLKIEYGNDSGNQPKMQVSTGTGTNGAGTLTGYVMGPWVVGWDDNPDTTGSYWECNMSSGVSRLGAMLFRNGDLRRNTVFAIERTKDADGTDNSDGFTMVVNRVNAAYQRTTAFGAGLSQELSKWAVINAASGGTTLAFNNKIPMSPVFPCYGKYGNPMTQIGMSKTNDMVEGSIFTTTLYGVSMTYLASKNYYTSPTDGDGILMRWE